MFSHDDSITKEMTSRNETDWNERKNHDQNKFQKKSKGKQKPFNEKIPKIGRNKNEKEIIRMTMK